MVDITKYVDRGIQRENVRLRMAIERAILLLKSDTHTSAAKERECPICKAGKILVEVMGWET